MLDTDLRRELAALHEKLDRVTAALERFEAHRKNDAKWKSIFRKQVASLIRAQYLGSDLAAPHAIEARRFRLRSQNEEDGIILSLLQATGVTNRRFVEIGSGGSGGNSGVLAYELGWSGVMLDASGSAIRDASALFAAKPQVTVARKMVTPETIDRVLRKAGFTGEVDLLSIDIDSFDYWLLDALTVTTARVLVMEYNASFGPERAVTLPNAPKAKGMPKAYYGASLTALDKCAQRKGYRLVLCEDAGVNAFFVRHDLAPGIITLRPEQAWRPRSNRWDPSGETPMDATDVFKLFEEKGLPLVEV